MKQSFKTALTSTLICFFLLMSISSSQAAPEKPGKAGPSKKQCKDAGGTIAKSVPTSDDHYRCCQKLLVPVNGNTRVCVTCSNDGNSCGTIPVMLPKKIDDTDSSEPNPDYSRKTKQVDVAYWDKATNSIRLFEDRLAKTFENGTPIDLMRIEQVNDAIYLVREGKGKDGNCITSTIELEPNSQNQALALPLNGSGGDNRCHGFLCSKCNKYDATNGCKCASGHGWMCNHETRFSNSALNPSILFIR